MSRGGKPESRGGWATEAAALRNALRNVEMTLQEVESLARSARGLASEWSGWNGQSVKDHLEAAQASACEAGDTAAQAAMIADEAQATAQEALREARFTLGQVAALWDAIEALGGDTSGRELSPREQDLQHFLRSLPRRPRAPGAGHD